MRPDARAYAETGAHGVPEVFALLATPTTGAHGGASRRRNYERLHQFRGGKADDDPDPIERRDDD